MPDNKNKHAIASQNALIVITDPKGVVRYASDDFCQLSGYSQQDLLGKNISLIRHPEMPDGPLAQMWETISAGHPWMGVILNRTRQGTDMWADTYIIPIIEDGRITEYQCIYRTPDDATAERARQIYSLRRQGKMPPALKRKPLSLRSRVILGSLLTLSPLAVAALTQAPNLFTGLGVFLSLLLAVIAAQLTTRRFNALTAASRQIVSHPVKQLVYTGTTDDIGQLALVQRMLQSQLDAILRRIQNASTEVQRSSTRSAEVMHATFGNIQSQQESLEQIAAAIEEMTATTGEVAENTRHALDQVQQAQADAAQGTDVVHTAVDAIKALDNAIDQIGKHLQSLELRSNQIDKVVEVIHDIAEKTNLLALNAAIEAARAGENGRGFAVVADEVRALAQRTRVSTSEISAIIEGLQSETGNISSAMQQGQTLASETVQRIETAGQSLLAIIDAVSAISNMTHQIASATEQQSITTQEVNTRIHLISDAAGQASAQAQQTLSLNQDTARLAHLQRNMVERIIACN
jgi:aerotaxis receptor